MPSHSNEGSVEKPVWEMVAEAASRLPDWIRQEVFGEVGENSVQASRRAVAAIDMSQARRD
jgi:hypothetical protein